MKIGILGDSFIDRWHVGTVKGLSAEAPIPSVNVLEVKEFAGGAANVRANFRALGQEAVLLMPPTERNQNYPIKNRLLADGVQIARWDEKDWCGPLQREDLLALMDCNALVVSDYGKGSLSEEVIQCLRGVKLPLFVDTKGDPKVWLGAEDVTVFPNSKEYKQFRNSYAWFNKCVLKLGEVGLEFRSYGEVLASSPAKARFVKSVCGAGDTVLAMYPTMVLSGASVEVALDYANAAAAIVVEKPFTSTASSNEVNAVLSR